jgi:GMP synthase (glutamine-hydrolysing)
VLARASGLASDERLAVSPVLTSSPGAATRRGGMTAKKRILLLKPGVTSSRAVLGDYEAWFGRGCGDVELARVELHAGETPPAVDGFDGVIMTGSPLSVTQPVEWMVRAADYLLASGERGKPVLGVCFGHQLLAWAGGARVARNPLGRELGTVRVWLTDEGQRSPLLEGFPDRFEVQATHEDIVVDPPPALTVLARNAVAAVQAFQLGPRSFGVQFHPEMDAASIQFCIDAKDTRPEDRAKAVARETPMGERLLRRFVSLC